MSESEFSELQKIAGEVLQFRKLSNSDSEIRMSESECTGFAEFTGCSLAVEFCEFSESCEFCYRNFPGFNIPFSSNAALTRRISSRSIGVNAMSI